MPIDADEYDALAGAVVLFLGVGDDPQAKDQAKSACYLMTQLVKGYTRGVGFYDDAIAEDLQGVIILAAARLTTNPQQSNSESESSPLLRFGVANQPVNGPGEGQSPEIAVQSFAFSGGFSGFTDTEKAILHKYRVRNG